MTLSRSLKRKMKWTLTLVMSNRTWKSQVRKESLLRSQSKILLQVRQRTYTSLGKSTHPKSLLRRKLHLLQKEEVKKNMLQAVRDNLG